MGGAYPAPTRVVLPPLTIYLMCSQSCALDMKVLKTGCEICGVLVIMFFLLTLSYPEGTPDKCKAYMATDGADLVFGKCCGFYTAKNLQHFRR